MVNSVIKNEFVGQFGILIKDGELIYAYDEITHGLYEFSLDCREVDMIISPESIHWNMTDRIMAILKNGNEIILVPQFLNSEWIFYDLKEKKIRYKSVMKKKIAISSAIIIESNVFLVPTHVYDPIMVLSLDDMKIMKIYENWYGKNVDKTNGEILIWEAFPCEDFVTFLIVNTREVVCVSINEVRIITLDIPNPAHSVSICKDKIWILPISGEYLYAVNFRGKITDKINLNQTESGILPNKFIKIVAIEENIFLLPVYGESINVYQCGEKQIVKIETKGKPLKGRLFRRDAVSYWGVLVENEILHLLPCNYPYKKIYLNSLKCEEYNLCYGKHIDYTQYWDMAWHVQKDCIVEKEKSDLEDFYQSICSLCESPFPKENQEIGKKIWRECL